MINFIIKMNCEYCVGKVYCPHNDGMPPSLVKYGTVSDSDSDAEPLSSMDENDDQSSCESMESEPIGSTKYPYSEAFPKRWRVGANERDKYHAFEDYMSRFHESVLNLHADVVDICGSFQVDCPELFKAFSAVFKAFRGIRGISPGGTFGVVPHIGSINCFHNDGNLPNCDFCKHFVK